MTDAQVFFVRAWLGATAHLYVAVRRLHEADWVSLPRPEALADYVRAALGEARPPGTDSAAGGTANGADKDERGA
ncbi:MAG TPA: hypothetical protein VNK91_00185 [Burkholderiaceae bacterium]|jgi:hypothetical protein|nr:hypothetical protein [Burkholderiaceae bacterium]